MREGIENSDRERNGEDRERDEVVQRRKDEGRQERDGQTWKSDTDPKYSLTFHSSSFLLFSSSASISSGVT